MPHLEYQDLVETDPNLLGIGETPGDPYYRILIDQSQAEIVAKLEELKGLIERGEFRPWEFRTIKAIWFGRHLYQPLLYLQEKIVEISPVPLNKGERQFVEDLKAFHDNDGGFFTGKELYLLLKEIEARLGDPGVHLHSFIVSNTPSHTMRLLWGIDKSAMNDRHVLFQEEDRDKYVRNMLTIALGSVIASEQP